MADEASFPSYIVRNQRPVMNQNVAILRKCASLLFTLTRLELVVGLLTHHNLGACPIKDVDFACPFGNAANAILYPSNQQLPYTFFCPGVGVPEQDSSQPTSNEHPCSVSWPIVGSFWAVFLKKLTDQKSWFIKSKRLEK